MAAWLWDAKARTYRSAATGALVALATLRSLKRRYLQRGADEADRLAARLGDGSLSAAGWESSMQGLIATSFTAMGLLGRGGVNAMTPQDAGPIEAAIQHQFDYLGQFKDAVLKGDVSPQALVTRSRLYPLAAGSAFEVGRARAFGGLSLRQVPGDGQTQCLSNCHCALSIEEDEDEWRVTWELGDSDSCPDCLAQADEWNPLVVRK